MELVLVRVDARLIHGQVSVAWIHDTGVTRLMVANDRAATDSMERSILKMAKPRSIAVLDVLTLDAAADMILKDTSKDKVMLITRTPRDIQGLVDRGVRIDKVNLGNMPPGPGKIKLDESVCADADEMEILRDLVKQGIIVFTQMTPAHPKIDISPKL